MQIYKWIPGFWRQIIQLSSINIWIISRQCVKNYSICREGLKEVHQKFTLMGERRTDTHTHTPAGRLSSTHSRAKHTLCHCSICLSLSPPLLSNLTLSFSHYFPLSTSISHICHPSSSLVVFPSFCSCALLLCNKYVDLFQIFISFGNMHDML